MKYIKKFDFILENKRFENMDEYDFMKYYLEIHTADFEIVDGLIESDSAIYLDGLGLTKLPFKFSNVFNGFYCSNNKLTSLEGSPFSCMWFECSNNELTNLKGSPSEVMEDFICDYNKLTTLSDGPDYVNNKYKVCNNKELETLDINTEVSGNLIITDNNIYNFDDFNVKKALSSIYMFGNPLSKLLNISVINKNDKDIIVDRIKKIVQGKKVNLNQLKLFYRIINENIPENLEKFVTDIGYHI